MNTVKKFVLDFTCLNCEEGFTAEKGKFFLSTDRIHGEETKQIRAKCPHCSKWRYYPQEIASIGRASRDSPLPRYNARLKTAGRELFDSTPSYFKDEIEEINQKLKESGYDMEETDGEE